MAKAGEDRTLKNMKHIANFIYSVITPLPLRAHDAPSSVLLVESPRPFFRGLLVWQGAYLRAAKRILVLEGERRAADGLGYTCTLREVVGGLHRVVKKHATTLSLPTNTCKNARTTERAASRTSALLRCCRCCLPTSACLSHLVCLHIRLVVAKHAPWSSLNTSPPRTPPPPPCRPA